MNNADKIYDDFWSDKITTGVKYRQQSWFRRRRYQWLSYLFPRLALRTWPARGYHRGVVSIAEGFFADLGCGLGACAGLYYASQTASASRHRRVAGATGGQTCLSAGRRQATVGIDASPTAIRFALAEKKRLKFKGLNFLPGDLVHIPLKNNLFDTVYLGQVLEHVESEHRVLQEAVRVLKPDGKLIITVPKENLLPSPYHVRIYTAESLVKLLQPYANGQILFHEFDRKRLAVSLRIMKI